MKKNLLPSIEGVVDIVNRLSLTSSNNGKKEILKANKDNSLLKDILEFVYSIEFKTGIKRKKLEKEVNVRPFRVLEGFYSLKEYLLDNNTGSDEVIATLQMFLRQEEEDTRDLYTKIILQDLRCGLKEKTINAAFGYEFIYVHKMEKGEVAEPRHLRLLTGREFGIYKKVDGYRAEIEVGSKSIKIMSSGGELYRGLKDLEMALKRINLPQGVFACELLAIDAQVIPMTRMERFNKTGSILRRDGVKRGIEAHIFNFIPGRGFYEGYHPMTCRDRKTLAKSLIDKINSPFIKNIDPFYVGKDLAQIDIWFEKMVEQDDEGIMVLPLDQDYHGKKSWQQMLKIKTEKEADLKIIGFERGEKGKCFENTLGKIIVDYKGVPVSVMAGYKTLYDPTRYDSRLVRDYIWKHQKELMGKIVRVKYMDESVNDSGGLDLRLCRLVCFRDDKTEPSYN